MTLTVPSQPLDDGRLAILAEEVLIHTRLAHAAFMDLLSHSATIRGGKQVHSVALWRDVQVFLMHAGMVSKFLNPLPGKGTDAAQIDAFRAWRVRQLQRVIGTPDTTGLTSRTARNFVEHIDENVDPWIGGDEFANPPLIRRWYLTRADRDADANPGFWCRIFIAEEMLFCFENDAGRQEVKLWPIHQAIEAIDAPCALFWSRVFDCQELSL